MNAPAFALHPSRTHQHCHCPTVHVLVPWNPSLSHRISPLCMNCNFTSVVHGIAPSPCLSPHLHMSPCVRFAPVCSITPSSTSTIDVVEHAIFPFGTCPRYPWDPRFELSLSSDPDCRENLDRTIGAAIPFQTRTEKGSEGATRRGAVRCDGGRRTR